MSILNQMATGSNFVGVVDVYPELSDYRVRCPHINKLEIKNYKAFTCLLASAAASVEELR